MSIDEIKHKLAELFDLSDLKQNSYQEELSSIIQKLENKKHKLKEELMQESEEDQTTGSFSDLEKEYEVVSRLLKKARKHLKEEGDEQY